ncbi:hypothetical protein GCM10011576_57010 [Micromonospora parathelypteridis]|nr:hypothetical protein GCM10011576_57010 [Micromonospora parathelypteridis]
MPRKSAYQAVAAATSSAQMLSVANPRRLIRCPLVDVFAADVIDDCGRSASAMAGEFEEVGPPGEIAAYANWMLAIATK